MAAAGLRGWGQHQGAFFGAAPGALAV